MKSPWALGQLTRRRAVQRRLIEYHESFRSTVAVYGDFGRPVAIVSGWPTAERVSAAILAILVHRRGIVSRDNVPP